MDDVAVYVGEAVVTALKAMSQFEVVDAEAVEHGSMEVVDLYDVFHGVIAQLVGGTMADATLDTATCHPHGEAFDVVIAT